MSVTESQIAAACRIASQVYSGKITATNGCKLLTDVNGLNKTYADIFINNYEHLMEGEVFKRTMSAPAMRYFIEQINNEHGEQRLAQALTSLRAHIEYYEGHYKRTMHKMRAVVEDFEALSQEPRNLSEVEHLFDEAVTKSLGELQSTRLHRLAIASKMPRTILVQSTVYVRNPDVVAEVLMRAAGMCERCKCEAPFRRAKDGTPYLEVHHKVRLANVGEDSIENAIALCPNCHREAHFGGT